MQAFFLALELLLMSESCPLFSFCPELAFPSGSPPSDPSLPFSSLFHLPSFVAHSLSLLDSPIFPAAVGMGYIPFLIDNFSHLGGLGMGLLLGIILYPCISTTKRHKIIVWCLRVVAAVLIVLGFVLVTINVSVSSSFSI
jgi:hypothetical protein